jgi:hypothetical protein
MGGGTHLVATQSSPHRHGAGMVAEALVAWGMQLSWNFGHWHEQCNALK